MSGYSNNRKDLILEATMGGAAYSEAEENFLALVTVAVVGGDDGTTITEPTYAGYARIPMLATDWAAAAGGEKKNSVSKDFPESTGGTPTIHGWAYVTTPETKSGLVICSGTTPEFVVVEGKPIKFKIGALVYRLLDT